MEEFESDLFIEKVTEQLEIEKQYMEINSLKVGSVIVDYNLFPPGDLEALRAKQA